MTHIPFKVSLLRLVFLLLPVTVAAQEARLSDYVDPRIGSEGLGRVFIGPSCPYGSRSGEEQRHCGHRHGSERLCVGRGPYRER